MNFINRATAVSANDPHLVPSDKSLLQPVVSPSGKTVTTPRLNSGESTAVFVVCGQSNAANYALGAYTPPNASKIDNLNAFDGGTYAAANPLLGSDGTDSNLFLDVANSLITDGKYARVILIPVACGSTSVNQWATNAALYQRLEVAGRRAAAVGLNITAFLWMQGESDTSLGTSQAAYAGDLATVIGKPRAAGFTAPWLVGRCSFNGVTTSSAVTAAQTAAVNGTSIFAGGSTDSLTGATNRQTGIAHFTAAGRASAATIWANAIKAAL